MSALWLPGQGMVSLEGTAVDRAVREYDERLFFARNANTGYFCVFVRMGPSEEPIPVLGYPEVPPTERVLHDLARRDTQRRGDQILRDVHIANDKAREKSRRDGDEATGVLAEGMESFLHDQGLTPFRRIYRPVKKTAVRGH